MTETAKLRIPQIAAAQAQKHVTHNEGMALLDTLVQLSVLDRDLSTPPAEPEEGDAYIVAGKEGDATAAGAWLGWEGRVVRMIDGVWRSYLPGAGGGAGWLAWVMDEDAMVRFDGEEWDLAGIEGPQGPAGADGALSGEESVKTGNHTVVAGDHGGTLVASASEPVTFALTAAAAIYAADFRICLVKNAGPAPLTLDPDGSETVNGEAALVLAAGQGALLWTQGTLWRALVMGVATDGWLAIGVAGGEAVMDLSLSDRFLLTVDDDCALLVPANARPGQPFALRVVMDGAHAFAFGEGWLGDAPQVLTGNGDETVLSGVVLDTGPTTAVVNMVKQMPAD